MKDEEGKRQKKNKFPVAGKMKSNAGFPVVRQGRTAVLPAVDLLQG